MFLVSYGGDNGQPATDDNGQSIPGVDLPSWTSTLFKYLPLALTSVSLIFGVFKRILLYFVAVKDTNESTRYSYTHARNLLSELPKVSKEKTASERVSGVWRRPKRMPRKIVTSKSNSQICGTCPRPLTHNTDRHNKARAPPAFADSTFARLLVSPLLPII